MLNLPLVSFIVTSYNYEKYILKTLESIINQTYKNFEIIVVDDFSNDNSVEIIKDFIATHSDVNIKFIEHDQNFGQLKSFQSGLKAANGQFISFVDSDDVLTKYYTEAHLKIHLATSVAFTSCQIIEIDENDNIHTLYSPSSPHSNPAMEITELDELLNVDIEKLEYKLLDSKSAPFGGWYWSPTTSAMFRRASLEIILNYKDTDNWRVCPDKFIFNLLNLIGGSAVIYAPLVGYRRHKLNAGQSSYVTGNKRYNGDSTTRLNIKNNLKIRPLTLKFMLENSNKFSANFGNKNFIKLFLTVIFSYVYDFKRLLKI